MRYLISFCLSLFFISILNAQPTLQERLGYDKDAKLLIIHADDLGVSHSENAASIAAMEKGSVSSASIMMPTHWVPEIAAYAREHPDADFGLHLTLTAEWKHLKWGPAAPVTTVPSLVNEHGFLYDNCEDFAKNAKLEEVEIELRAQIERAIAFGILPTHFDSHMGCLFFQSPELFGIYLKLSREYKVPVLLSSAIFRMLGEAYSSQIKPEDILLDQVIMASPPHFKSGMSAFYAEALRGLPPGVHELILHAAYDDAEMQAVAIDHPDYGAAWRQADFDFFTSEECAKILKEEGIQLVTWREIKELLD